MTSPMYSMSVRYFDNGTPEEWLMFQKALSKVLIGQNITTGPPTYGMVRRLMEGAALSKFDESAHLHDAETFAHYEEVMGHYPLCLPPAITTDSEEVHASSYEESPLYEDEGLHGSSRGTQ